MTPERWEKVTEIYNSALELKTDARKIYLERVCADDETLRDEVESLLAVDAEAGNFITGNVLKNAVSLFDELNSPSLSGVNLGHYQILSRIGSGGMGEVYLAKDTRLERFVAVKFLPVSFSKNPLYLRRFQTEARAAATLNHPNIATIYSVENISEQQFITMEFVEGKTLDSMIPATGLDLKTFLEWFIKLSDALAHAHEKGIIHRDIKPGNIMVSPANVPKILDFGLAQIDPKNIASEASTLSLTKSGQILGTPAYMSPEQAEGEPIDSRTDIFSLGIVMYEAMTGERPFKGESYASIVSALLTKEPPPVSDIKPDTPFLLSRLIMRCLSKNPSRRFQTMQEVRVILEELKAAVEAGISMDSGSLKLVSEKSFLSQKGLFVPLFLLIFITFGLGFYFLTRETSPPISFENLTLRKLSQTNNVVYAHITPDGKSVAYNTIENDEQRSLWIRRVEDKNALQLLPPQPVFFWGGLTVSKDGSQIYYITATRGAPHGTLYRISSLGGVPRKIAETVNDLGSLSPDGERVLYVRYGEKMQLLSANAAGGGDEREILSADSGTRKIYRDPQFSADGTKIFFIKYEVIGGEEFWSLVEIPASGGEEKVILNPRKPKISEIAVLRDGNGLLVNSVEPVSNLPQIFYVSLSDAAEKRLTNDLNAYFGISASDDGKTIVTAQRLFAKNISVFSGDNPNQANKISRESNIYSTAVFTPDGRIVYDAADNNRPHIWIMNADGSNPQQLTPNDSTDFQPLASPDGRYIFFISERTGDRKIWRMDIDGSNQQNLTPFEGIMFSHNLNPEKQTVFFDWNKNEKKVMGEVPIAGGEIREFPLFGNSLAAYSADGKQVAYVFIDEKDKKRKVRVRPFEQEEPATVLDISPIEFMRWTADGKGLLYREIETDTESVSTVWLQTVSGGKPQPFLSVKPDMVFNVSQSMDGKQTAVVSGNLLTDAVMLSKIESN